MKLFSAKLILVLTASAVVAWFTVEHLWLLILFVFGLGTGITAIIVIPFWALMFVLNDHDRKVCWEKWRRGGYEK